MRLTKEQLQAKLDKAEADLEQERKKATYSVSHCTVTNNSAANEHTRASVVALSEAIKANAEAVIATANALKGGPAMGTGIKIVGGQ